MSHSDALHLMPGEPVEVRSPEEILATLDENGCVEGLPFMPEMLAYCGRRFLVRKRADKTCDTVEWTGLRRMTGTVHLANLRCDGESHGGCQAGCLLFWKEVWLKRAAANDVPAEPDGAEHGQSYPDAFVAISFEPGRRVPTWSEASSAVALLSAPSAVEQQLTQWSLRPGPVEGPDVSYRCQSTEIREATSRLFWWDVRQYWRDMRYNGVSFYHVVRGVSMAIFNGVLKKLKIHPFPRVWGKLDRTPTQVLNLQPGELVEVKSKAEIIATLDRDAANRGMYFEAELIPYCGKRYRVLRRVEHILDEKTGRMRHLQNPAIILNEVTCTGYYHRFCQRAIYPYWREIWLRRVDEEPAETSRADDR